MLFILQFEHISAQRSIVFPATSYRGPVITLHLAVILKLTDKSHFRLSVIYHVQRALHIARSMTDIAISRP